MSLRIQTNVAAMDAHRNLVNTSNQLSQSMERCQLRLPHQLGSR